VYSKELLDSPRESLWGTTQREQKQGLEFSESEYDEIDSYCQSIGIEWFASAWDSPSLEFLEKYNPKYQKVASAMATNIEFVENIAAKKRLTFLSTGMCTLEKIGQAVKIFEKSNCPLVLLHTVSTYPSQDGDLNLKALQTIRNKFNIPVGYSGHEASVSPSVMAAVLGAVVIERHITLDRSMYGSDQSASLEWSGLSSLVEQIRKVPNVIGNGEKVILDSEYEIANKLRYWEND
jgi:N-acetylneuraminate synthase